jgi:hypothetical protein
MSGLYDRFKEGLGEKEHDMTDDAIMIALLDLTQLGTDVAILSSTNATPIVVTTEAAHGLSNGDSVSINGHDNTNANAYWKVANITSDTAELVGSTPTGVGGNNGYMMDLTNDTALADITAAVVDTAEQIATPTFTSGVFDDDGSNITFTAVTGNDCQALGMYNDAGTSPIADPLVALIDDATGLPVSPNSGDITVTFDAAGIFAL